MIERNARVQAQLIEDLLDMSRIVAGQLRLDVQRVELRDVIKAALEAVMPAAEAKRVRVQTVLDTHVGQVRGDSARLQQVVWNLLNNAIKFTPKGGSVMVALERVNSHIELTVTDSGIGIAHRQRCDSAFSLYFAKAFFPPASQTAQLLNVAAVFAVGFLMRPSGGWLMGRYADRHGRRAALTTSVLMMCAGSLLIALTPSYAKAGMLAPSMLVLARLLQGLSVGGEYGASATYLSEMAGKQRRGFYSSFQYVTLIMGQLLALAVLLILQRWLSEAQLEAWGWRIPFVVGAGFALVVFRTRRNMEETTAFHAEREPHSPLRLLAAHWRQVATVVGLTAGGTVAFYTFTTYAQKFLVNTAGWTKPDATLASAASLFVFMLVQPLVGLLSDRVGRRPVLIAFGVLGTLGTVPMLKLLAGTTSVTQGFLLLTLALLVVSGYTAINAVVKAELFPTTIRALGVGFPYAVTVSVLGGTAEYLALWAKSDGHEQWYYWYVTACVAASLFVYAGMRDTRTRSLIKED